MKLNYTIKKISEIVCCESISFYNDSKVIESVSYDTRRIIYPENTLFFALVGDYRDGHNYISDAYNIGVRNFCISKEIEFSEYKDANFIKVKNTLFSLQEFASFHRKSFNVSLIVITGSVGKTSVKEWLYSLLSLKFHVVRSPKSYNSQIGVALSLLEIQDYHQIAIIECGISKQGEMDILEKIVKPDIGILTSFGCAHENSFKNKEEHLKEKLKLFKSCSKVFYLDKINLINANENFIPVKKDNYIKYFDKINWKNEHQKENASLCIEVAKYYNVSDEIIIEKIHHLPNLALRMEIIDGKNNTLLINDTYNADLDSLNSSLEFLQSFEKISDKSLVLGIDDINNEILDKINKSIKKYRFKNLIFVKNENFPPVELFKNEVILAKGTRKSNLEKWIALMQENKHQTYLEIDLRAMKSNLIYWKSLLRVNEKLLVMVKASAYGIGSLKIAKFLQNNGVDYLGVAYAKEGIELRNNGIVLPILVMNTVESDFLHLLQYNLEPSIYSIKFLELFINFLIKNQKVNYPIHLKFDTGMKRLGIEQNELNEVLDIILSQNEVKIQSVYSHLATSDDFKDDSFVNFQVETFNKMVKECENRFSYPFLKHICNTEAIYKNNFYKTDMVRLGIGLYGVSLNRKIKKNLKEVLQWKSNISQIKNIKKEESIGYGRSYIAKSDMRIAIIPVGYADGFRRCLSNGKGGVYIKNSYCKVLGKVCMDMIMVDVSAIDVTENEEVEIIGHNQNIEKFSKKMNTIPYETLSTFSTRLNRIYIED